ncbi:hypothetical protein DYI95_006080 [Thermaerobacter sp. PB12/4term]|uniref:hypothetical protein n=1 Tax=Thermaerobacter sp. PB12/4term TaxID=2293838 RepID=UPI000E32CF7E|nr:hypothetical protein [Thermaerobacter sp. PB12/4term]QIA27146.1 hypothetical protein DYI95_006080 [Thermaerobacter sp. PB12/4term]
MTQPMVPAPRPRPPRLRRRRRPGRPVRRYYGGPGTYGAPIPPEPRPGAGWWERFKAELAYVASLKTLWLAVALGGLVAGFLLGTWFGHQLAAAAHLR